MKALKQLRHFCFQYFQHISIPSYGAFAALKRYSSLSRRFYPQYFTWNTTTWKPELTRKTKLIPWFIMSLFVFCITLSFFYIGFREILVPTKNLEMSSIQVLLLVLYTSTATLASASILSFILVGDKTSFVLGNLQTLRNSDGKCVQNI